jgi:hypothetical protein
VDSSINLPQGGEIDNGLQINQPDSQASPERRGSDERDMMGKAKNGRQNFFHSAKLRRLRIREDRG